MWHSREWPPKNWKGEAECMSVCEKPITKLVKRAARKAKQDMPDNVSVNVIFLNVLDLTRNKKWKPDEFLNIICEYRCNNRDFGGVIWHDGSSKFQFYEYDLPGTYHSQCKANCKVHFGQMFQGLRKGSGCVILKRGYEYDNDVR